MALIRKKEYLDNAEDFANGIELLSRALNDFVGGSGRRLSLSASIGVVKKIITALDDMSGFGGVLVSAVLSIPGFLDNSSTEILSKLDEISSKVDKLASQVKEGIEKIENKLDSLDIQNGLKKERQSLDSLNSAYISFLGSISDKVANAEYREKFRAICNNDNGNIPEDIFRRLYQKACKDCSIPRERGEGNEFDVDYTGELNQMFDILDDRYTSRDDIELRSGFGRAILSGLIDAYLLQIQCLPQVPSVCLSESDVWLNKVDAMKVGIVEVASNIYEHAENLNLCHKSHVQLSRVSTINIHNLDKRWHIADGTGNVEVQYRLNGENYMPRKWEDCFERMCKPYVDQTWDTKGCDYKSSNFCVISKKNNDGQSCFNSDRMENTPIEHIEDPIDLRFHGVEQRPGDDHQFEIATFTVNEWYKPNNGCNPYYISKSVVINDANADVEINIIPELRS